MREMTPGKYFDLAAERGAEIMERKGHNPHDERGKTLCEMYAYAVLTNTPPPRNDQTDLRKKAIRQFVRG